VSGPCELIGGRYELRAGLGRGAMGSVWRAFDRDAGREVALKLLSGDQRPVARERFQREAELTARLRHPGIVRIHAAGEHAGQPYLVYELVEGGRTLEEEWRDRPPAERLDLLEQVADAVGAAHAEGIVHRDLKPSNVLIDAAGRARVADFGVALDRAADRLTRTGAMVGSPTYMSPEQLAGERDQIGPASDVWSLSVILCELLSGQPPFHGSSLLELSAQIAQATPSVPRGAVEGPLRALILAGLQRDPGARPADASEFSTRLRAARGAGETSPRPWLAIALAIFLGALGLLAGALARERSGEAATAKASPSSSPRRPAGVSVASPARPPTRVTLRLPVEHPHDLAWWSGELLVAAERGLHLFDPASGALRRSWPGSFRACAVLPSGSVLLQRERRELHLLHARDAEPQLLARRALPLYDLRVSADGRSVAWREAGEVVLRSLVQTPSGGWGLREAWRALVPSQDPRDLEITPTRVYCASKGALVSWDRQSGAVRSRHDAGPLCFARDEAGQVLACGYANGSVELRDANTARLLRLLSARHAERGPVALLELAHLGSVRALCFAGGRLISTDRNDDPRDSRREEDGSTLSIWRLESGERLGWELCPREGAFSRLRAQPGGDWLALARRSPPSVVLLRSLSSLERSRGGRAPR